MKQTTQALAPHPDRIYLYDNAKCLAIVLVVIGHTIDIITSVSADNFFSNGLFTAIYGVHMPLFIFISGLFTKPMQAEEKFPSYKVLSFLLIAIVLRIVSAIERIFFWGRPVYTILNMHGSFTWFLDALAAFLVITWIFRRFNKWAILGIAFAVGCMAGYDGNLRDRFSLLRIAVFLPLFLLGYCLEPVTLMRFLRRWWIRLIGGALLIVYLVFCFTNLDFILNFRKLFSGHNSYTIFGPAYLYGGLLRLLAYAISILAVLAVLALLPNRSLGVVTSTGKKTLQIYFWHRLMLYPLESFAVYQIFEENLGIVWAHILYILIGFAIAAFCALPFFAFPTKQLLSIGKPKPKA